MAADEVFQPGKLLINDLIHCRRVGREREQELPQTTDTRLPLRGSHINEFTTKTKAVPGKMFLQSTQVREPQILARSSMARADKKERWDSVSPQDGRNDGSMVAHAIVEAQ